MYIGEKWKVLESKELLVIKNTVSELKISLDYINSRLDTAENKVSELESIVL